MKRTSLATLLLSMAFAALTAQTAMAVGTPACTSIANTATVSYKVGTVAQTPASNLVPATFIVGNKINFTVANAVVTDVPVAPGETGRELSFTVTNTGNANQTFLMAWSNGATNSHSGSADTINMLTPGVDTLGTASIVTGVLIPGANQVVKIIADTPATPNNNDVAVYIMTGTAYKVDGTTIEAQNSSSITSSAGTCSTDIVFADSDTDTLSGSARNGKDSDVGAFIVTADSDFLTVGKSSAVYSDPINGVGPTPPKMIPGAVVTYTITLTNGSATTTASTVSIADTLNANLGFGNNDTTAPYGSSNGAYRDGTYDCTASGANFGVVIDGVCTDSSAMWADPTLTISGLSVPPGPPKIIKFQANIK